MKEHGFFTREDVLELYCLKREIHKGLSKTMRSLLRRGYSPFTYSRTCRYHTHRTFGDMGFKRHLDPVDDLLHLAHLLLTVKLQEDLDIHA